MSDLLDRPVSGQMTSQLSKREEMAALILGGMAGTQASRPIEERVTEAVQATDLLIAKLHETEVPNEPNS